MLKLNARYLDILHGTLQRNYTTDLLILFVAKSKEGGRLKGGGENTMLGNTNLHSLDARIKVPSYDRTALQPHIVHLGLGHFHRSHFCYYLHQLLEQGVTNWGIEEIDLVPSIPPRSLKSRDYLYTLCSKDPEGNREMTVTAASLAIPRGGRTSESNRFDETAADTTHHPHHYGKRVLL
jgi:hypothetical protein